MLLDGGMVADSSEKTRRQRQILEIVQSRPVATQEELLMALVAKGVEVTQSTLSRDLKDLRVSRVPTAEDYRYLPADASDPQAGLTASVQERLQSVAALEINSIEANEVSVVISTLPGRGQGLAHYLDALKLPDILGTVAGDDTILVLPRSTRRTGKLHRQLASLLGLD
jgi:transcriptional regulator of arginine metabolism